MARLSLTRRSTQFDRWNVVAVADRSSEFDGGGPLVPVGPSGHGTSTTRRCRAGLEAVTAGDSTTGTARTNGLPPRERGIATLEEDGETVRSGGIGSRSVRQQPEAVES